MKINISTEEKNEEIVLPSEVFALGLECNGMTIVNGLEVLLPNVTANRKSIAISNDNIITVICYSSDDKSYYNIMAKYKGMKCLEFSVKNIKIIITI